MFGTSFWHVQRKKQTVASLKSVGATVLFDYQVERQKTPTGVPKWLHNLIGDYPVANVELVSFNYTAPATDTSVTLLLDLPNLKHVGLTGPGVTNASASILSRIPTLESINLSNTAITGRGLDELRVCQHIETVSLSGTAVDDAMIQGVVQFQALRHIQICRASITSAGLTSLTKCKSLEGIDLWESGEIDDTALVALEPIAGLKSLFIVNAPISDMGLQSCSSWPMLRFLRINSPQITDAGLTHLRDCPQLETLGFQQAAIVNPVVIADLRNLKELDLSATSIDAAGVESVAKAKSITSLSLHRTNLADPSILPLSKLSALHELTVGPDISEPAAKRLHQGIPQCKIRHVDEDGVYTWIVMPDRQLTKP